MTFMDSVKHLFLIILASVLVACEAHETPHQDPVIDDTTPSENQTVDTIIPIDNLFSGFAFQKEYYEYRFKDTLLYIKGKGDTVAFIPELKGTALILNELNKEPYDNGFFILPDTVANEISTQPIANKIITIRAKVKSTITDGMLGINIIFDPCEIVKIEQDIDTLD